MSARLVGRVCVLGCGRPARELGGHCTPCWMGLGAFARSIETSAHDAARAREIAGLDALWALETAQPRGRAA